MKKIAVIILVIIFLSGCKNENNKETIKKDYSKFIFTNVRWTRDAENDR